MVNPLGNALNVAASRIKIAAGFDASHAAALEGNDGDVVVLIGKVFLRFADAGKDGSMSKAGCILFRLGNCRALDG